jgi:tRNA(adenine34) deaminase
MKEALVEANKAKDLGEVPIGAVAVYKEIIIARAHNTVEICKDPTMHAEINLIREVARVLRTSRLTGITLYVTLEPCVMCAGAIQKAKIDGLIFGAYDDKLGAVGSYYDIIRDRNYKTSMLVLGGILEQECSAIIKEFFRNKR